MTTALELQLLPGRLAICRLDSDAPIPAWAWAGEPVSVTRTSEELSVVCAEARVPREVKAETGWRSLKVAGPLDFALTGILSSLVAPLARAKISIFAISTFDTDYLLVREADLANARRCLAEAGHRIAEG